MIFVGKLTCEEEEDIVSIPHRYGITSLKDTYEDKEMGLNSS